MKPQATQLRKILLGLALAATVASVGCDDPEPNERKITMIGTVRGVHCQLAIVELQNPADTVWGGGRGYLFDTCPSDSFGNINLSNCSSFPAIMTALCSECHPSAGPTIGALVTVEVPLDTTYRWPCPPRGCTTDLPRFMVLRSSTTHRTGVPQANCGIRID